MKDQEETAIDDADEKNGDFKLKGVLNHMTKNTAIVKKLKEKIA